MLKNSSSKISSKVVILAIETSSEQASVALLIAGDTSANNAIQLIERSTDGVTNHSQAILPMVQSVLHEAGLTLSDCSALAFGAGPGSFTGVRTACGVVQGLAFGANLPVIPIITLLAMAQFFRRQQDVLPVNDIVTALDARMNEVYWAHYYFDESTHTWHTRVAPTLCPPDQVNPQLISQTRLVGNGFTTYLDKFKLPNELLQFAPPSIAIASAIAELALMDYRLGKTLSAELAQPLYLRNKIAETIAERAAKGA